MEFQLLIQFHDTVVYMQLKKTTRHYRLSDKTLHNIIFVAFD